MLRSPGGPQFRSKSVFHDRGRYICSKCHLKESGTLCTEATPNFVVGLNFQKAYSILQQYCVDCVNVGVASVNETQVAKAHDNTEAHDDTGAHDDIGGRDDTRAHDDTGAHDDTDMIVFTEEDDDAICEELSKMMYRSASFDDVFTTSNASKSASIADDNRFDALRSKTPESARAGECIKKP